MKKKLLRLCSIVLVISMVLGNVVSLAADDTTSTETTGMTFSENLKGVIDNPFASGVKTVEATISLPETLPDGVSTYNGIILGTCGDTSLPDLYFGIFDSGDGKNAYPYIYYYESGMGGSYTAAFNYNFLSKKDFDETHLTFVLGESDSSTTTVSCYVDGEAISLCNGYEQPTVLFSEPAGKCCVGGDYSTDQARRFFKGQIYSLAAYTDARTEDEIKTDMTAVDTTDTELMAYYDLTTVDGSTIEVNNGATATKGTYDLNLIETWMDTRRPVLDEDNSAYSIALVGDTQIATEYDVMNNQANENGVVAGIYQWLRENKEEKNIKFVMGLGDIVQGEKTYALYQNTENAEVEKTDEVREAEWTYAMKQIQTLDGVIPYSLIRGNHDPQDEYINNVTQEHYGKYIDGALDETMLNTWQELVVGDIKYLILSLDLGASDTELKWAEEVIKTHPNHNVIISTHAYLNDDGTTLDANDAYHPDLYNRTGSRYPDTEHNRNNGDEMWANYFKKYDNIVMIVSGHIGSDDIIMTQAEGLNGNKVAQMLVDPQDLDFNLAKLTNTTPQSPTGMICLLNFSADGKTVQVEQYSTERGQWYMSTSQFTFELNVVEEQKLLFNTQQMPRHTAKDWFAKDGTSYSLVTYTSQAIVSADTTNIISYCAPSDGFIRITDMKVGFHSSQSEGVDNEGKAREFEFAVTNQNGEILSNYGDILLFNPNRTVEENLFIEEYEIQKGESIYFVIHGNAGSGTLVQCIPNIEFRIDSSDEWECVSSLTTLVPWPKDTTTWTDATAVQGMGGFYYHYSNSYEKVDCAEYNDKLILNAKPMTYTSGADWPFTSDNSNCKTQIPQIVVSAGTTNVISYQAKADGYIWIDEMYVWKRTGDTAAGYQVEFAVVDETGQVLTNNGEVYALDYYLTIPDAKASADNLVMTKHAIKKGERIYFVFHGIEGVTSVRCSADIQFCAEGDTVGTQVNMGIDNTQGMSLRKSGVDNTTIVQGTGDGDFFYEYSNVYEVVIDKKTEYLYIKPTDMGEYGANASFPFEQPDCGIKCMTRSGEIITSAGYTNVISYQVPENGELYIETMKVWIANYKEGFEAEFTVVNQEGKILTNNGKVYGMESVYVEPVDDTDDALKKAKSEAYAKAIADAKNLTVTKQNVKAGERIYFVFHGIKGDTQSLRCNAQIMFRATDESEWTLANGNYVNSEMTLYSKNNWVNSSSTVTAAQGIDNFYYQYSAQNTADVDGIQVGDENEGIVTIYEAPSVGATYGDKYITEVASDGTVSYIDLDMLNIKKQSKVNAKNSDNTDVRFIASVDNLNYKSVGFVFSNTAENSSPAIETVGEKAHRNFTTVYNRMKEDEGTRKTENIYAEDGCNSTYAFAFEMTNIPEDITIYARAYVELSDGTIVYGEPRAVTITEAGIAE